MNEGSTSLNGIDFARYGEMPRPQRLAVLRQGIDEMVGVTFFGQLLKSARASLRENNVFDGGQGERVFGGQLDMELARRAGRGAGNSLSDVLFERWSGKV